MQLPDGTILMHDATHAYDPVKAHEYYIRKRKLKGRKKGSEVIVEPAKIKPVEQPTAKRTRAKQLADIRRKLELLKSSRSSGDVQTRVAAEEAAKKSAAAKEVAAIRKELDGLTKSITKGMTSTEKAPIIAQIDKVKERLTAALEKAQSLSG